MIVFACAGLFILTLILGVKALESNDPVNTVLACVTLLALVGLAIYAG